MCDMKLLLKLGMGTGLVALLALSMGHIAEAETVTVDFAIVNGAATHRASGFLHGISTGEPDDQVVRPLKPKMFRLHASAALTPSLYRRLTDYGATVQSVMSDSYGYPGPSGLWPGDGGDWSRWEQLVEELVREGDSKGLQLLWDIWNEPDSYNFWKRKDEQFFETWKRAVRAIRRVNPKAIIVGPSLSNGPCHYLYGFLLSAHADNVLPDIISWHDMDDPDHPNNVVIVRQFMAKHGIPDRPISINEFKYSSGTDHPGPTVWWLSHIEEEAPESAAYSCWPDEGYSNCETHTLDGLLSRNGSRRAVWFAHKGYAEITGQLVNVEISGSRIVRIAGIAGIDADLQMGRLLLGRRKNLQSLSEESVEVVFRNVDRLNPSLKEREVFIRAERIPDSGMLDSPQVTIAAPYPVVNNEVRVRLPDFGAGDAYTVVLGRAADHVPTTVPH
jgi:Glycosyl hydrolases family 39